MGVGDWQGNELGWDTAGGANNPAVPLVLRRDMALCARPPRVPSGNQVLARLRTTPLALSVPKPPATWDRPPKRSAFAHDGA